ncbi:hypothetical protein E2I00_011691, partial [Balaenoptera physalus]
MSQWWEYPALPRGPGERAILKAKAICGGGRTGRLAKPGEFHIRLSSATQSRSGVQWRPMPTLFHLHLRGKTEKPGRQRCLRFLPITPTSLSFPEGAGQEPSSSFSAGPRRSLQLRGAPTLRALTWTFAPTPTSAPAPPAMDSAARDKMQPALPSGPEWPEQERAEQLARGAALKWASAREALGQAHALLQGMAEAAQTLEPLREQVVQHKQLQAMSQLLPRLRAVPAALAHTQTLIDAQRLLEAYVSLRELEQLQEETWAPLGGLELPVFEGLGPLAEALGQAVEAAAGAAGRLARENPALLVAAMRVAEVDAGRTTSLEQAARDWRQRCLRALQEGLERIHFGTPLQPGPGALAEWLEALRVALPAELAAAEALVAPCCPPHYNVVRLWAHTLHSGLRRCLQQLLEGPQLEAADAFTLLHWALHVYLGSVSLGQWEPLLTLENIEQLETIFVAKVQASVAQWLQKALDGDVAEWGREQEPDTDPSGFYHSPMPAIVLQILEENIRVTRMVSESLQRRVHGMALSELSAFLRSFSDALIRFSRDHLRGEATAPHYVPYLLATLNHQSALSSSVSVLQPDWVAPGALAPVEAALDELQRRICLLVLEALLAELQPLFAALPSRRWLSSPELLDDVCERTASFCQDFRHVRDPAVQLLNLRDPTLLGLEVAGLRQQFPDDHVSALLDLRGDVSREQRLAALSSLQAGPQPSPPA